MMKIIKFKHLGLLSMTIFKMTTHYYAMEIGI